MKEINYPLKFIPIFHEKIWGGNRLKELSANIPMNTIGEMWGLSGMDANVSIVSNGTLAGNSLTDLVREYKEQFLGKCVYYEFGDNFPLLFKFIDAKKDLSIQVHPNNELAKSRHGSLGKTEMWYVVEAEINSKLYAGFVKEANQKKYLQALEKKQLLQIIRHESAKKGDAYLIESGTIHTIGSGVLLAEIQQASDISYRLCDWERRDLNGLKRKLHTNLAFSALDFNQNITCKLKYNSTEGVQPVCNCSFFSVNKIELNKNLIYRELDKIDSFVVYMCVEGKGSIKLFSHKEKIKLGDTVLIPASADAVKICTEEKIELLEIYI